MKLIGQYLRSRAVTILLFVLFAGIMANALPDEALAAIGTITEIPSVSQILSTIKSNDLISLREHFD